MFCTLPTSKNVRQLLSGTLKFLKKLPKCPKVVQCSKKLLQSPNLQAFGGANLKAAAAWSCWVGASLEPQLWRAALLGDFVTVLTWQCFKVNGLTLWARKVPDTEGHGWLVCNLLLCLFMGDSPELSEGQITIYLQNQRVEAHIRDQAPGLS